MDEYARKSSLTKWTTITLGEIAQFRNGLNYTKKNFGRGLKVINVKDFQNYFSLSSESLEEINPDGILQKESLLREGDIVFVRSNGNRELIGRSLFIHRITEPISHSAFTIKLRFTSSKAIPKFYAYLFRSSLIRQTLSAQGNGTNISNLNQSILSSLEVPFPPTSTQRRIAAILSAYDDLIENNTRRIQILEEMARLTYEEWFVRFRFPGHENVGKIESELGLIPSGWEVKRLGDISNMQWGDTTKTKKEYVDVGYDAFSASGLDGKLPYYDFDHDGIVLSAIGAQCGLTWIARGKWSCIKNTMRYWSVDTEISNEYLFWSTHGQQFWTRRGAAQPFISLGDARSSRILKPTGNLLERYASIAVPAMRQVSMLGRKNLNLRRTRDLLLPKLISGEIDVSNFPNPSD